MTDSEAPRRSREAKLAAGAAAAGLAGGLALGARRGSKHHGLFDHRPRLLGMPLGPKPGVLRTVELLRDGAKHFDAATRRVAGASEDVHEIRAQLDRANRQSPLEVLLDGLTHRRGAHRNEG
ncbi:MAG TPA: hypothetical protein VEW67_06475 [Thermoleophilaceae bacterium]|nr:hypothetical protein [Thermoleophilaceae bacterium]